LGGRLGPGRQWWPWVSVADYTAAVSFLLRNAISGPVNMTAPNPVTNAEFTAQLGAALHRPTPWVIPVFAVRAVLGGFSDEVLGGQRALPRVLLGAGYRFLHADLTPALRAYTA
jgi:NAD dependent epimerase/dehydratase family enzyme